MAHPTGQELVDKIKDGKKKNIRVYPQHVVRASEVGHPCERYLVYSITHWDQKLPHGPEVEFIFEGGRAVEELAIQDLRDGGFKVYQPEPDRAIAESKPRITGHIDVRVDFGTGTVYTGEIKGLNVFDFNSLNTIQDFHDSKKPWIKKYPGQLMTYMYIKNEEKGFFYLKSIPRFQPKFIWVDLDYDYMESLLTKTERVEKHVDAGTLPPGVESRTVCEYCAFKHVCLPATIAEGELEFMNNDELLELIERREQLRENKKEFDQVDREIKKALPEDKDVVVGDYLITGQWIEKKGFTVEPKSYWKSKIIALNSVDED